MIGIYCISFGNRFYVGQSRKIKSRFESHISGLQKKCHHNQKLQNAFNKYGLHAFDFCVIELCDEKDLTDREQHWIDILDSIECGFNMFPAKPSYPHTIEARRKISRVCSGKLKGFKHSEETKRKMSLAKKGKPGHACSNETRLKMSLSQKGKIGKRHTLESCQKMSEVRKGKLKSEEHKRKISEGNKNKIVSEETRRKISETKKSKIKTPEEKQRMFDGARKAAQTMKERRQRKVLEEQCKTALIMI